MLPVKITHPFKDCGLFGAKRKHDIHTGIDMYCYEGAEVSCILDGEVHEVIQFTGEEVGSGWWNKTYAVAVKCGHFVYVYGEIDPCVKVGDFVKRGDKIGNVIPVLKENKGVTPTSMLHFETWYVENYRSNHTWHLGDTGNYGLLDPTLFLVPSDKDVDFWIIKTENGYKVEDAYGNYVQIFTLAADAKAFVLGRNAKYLKKSSNLVDKSDYTIYTGKTLWFDN